MTMPNFFIIGAQKAGTTSLYRYLDQHPEIYLSPVKEPRFFAREIDPHGEVVVKRFGGPSRRQPPRLANLDAYRALFRGVKGERAIGEASPTYIYAPGTAGRIKKYVPGARAIALLRNPADRAYSAYLHAVQIGSEPLTDFAQALQREEDRIRDNWGYVFHYRNRGLYHGQLERYFEALGRENVGVWLYEDLTDDPAGLVRDVSDFLGVDDTFIPDTSSKHNPAGVPVSGTARTVVKVIATGARISRKMLPPRSRIFSSTFPFASRTRQALQGRVLAKPPPVDPEVRRAVARGVQGGYLEAAGAYRTRPFEVAAVRTGRKRWSRRNPWRIPRDVRSPWRALGF